ncbi:hypothetical protein [Streptomyces brasiliscabiei]|uniref:hypothetical protein n=1 Tax=Streptomyces brasiliscabiei TaxID=2736302 RepID=UPI001C10C468|nr:hypothetical protein [Streptomyces brasiliscabiei]
MNLTPRTSRRRPGAARAAVLGLCAVGALGLVGCSGGGGTSGTSGAAGGSKPTATATAASDTDDQAGAQADTGGGATGGKSGDTSGAKGSTDAGGGAGNPGDESSASKSPAGSGASGTTGTTSAGTDGGDGGGDDCDHKMPISPDEIAVYRYTPEGGFLSLIVKHGNWGCGTPDSDGAPFETVGKETFIPLDQAADITVTTPIVESTENQPIGVQEFLDWLEAHPNSGLVFTYHLGGDGAIDRLDEVFTP